MELNGYVRTTAKAVASAADRDVAWATKRKAEVHAKNILALTEKMKELRAFRLRWPFRWFYKELPEVTPDNAYELASDAARGRPPWEILSEYREIHWDDSAWGARIDWGQTLRDRMRALTPMTDVLVTITDAERLSLNLSDQL